MEVQDGCVSECVEWPAPPTRHTPNDILLVDDSGSVRCHLHQFVEEFAHLGAEVALARSGCQT
jgi:hypothetical protein